MKVFFFFCSDRRQGGRKSMSRSRTTIPFIFQDSAGFNSTIQGDDDVGWQNGKRDWNSIVYDWGHHKSQSMRFKSTLGLESYSPVETIRQPVQCTLATQPGIIKNISRQQTPMNGRDTLLHTPQGRHMQVRMALKYMVEVGRENRRTPLERSYFPSTSYTIANDGSMVAPVSTAVPGRLPPGVTRDDEKSPRYRWQITRDKLNDDLVRSSPGVSFRAIADDETHPVARFGVSELRGDVRRRISLQGPVTNFKLDDEFHTNLAHGSKLVGGLRPQSTTDMSSNTASFLVRPQTSCSHGNSRIGTFHRGDPMSMPKFSAIEYQTRNLTESFNASGFPHKNENWGSKSGLMPTVTAGPGLTNY